MLDCRDRGLHNETMMNETRIGLTHEQTDALSVTARQLYNDMFDYCTYAADPQYQTLHRFRTRISHLTGRDRDMLIGYFNTDPAIQDHNMTVPAWEYFAAPY